MSSKSTPTSQVIALPQGGGALHGIGEKFAPDLHTGTGNFSFPISVPRGRGGFKPQLILTYTTGAGNGPFGLGWSLSVPGITRKTSQGIPLYDDASDTFILSGAEDLVPVSAGAAGATRFRPRTEGLFARIEHQRSANDDYWQVRGKDGLLSLYGTPGSAGNDPAVVADPANRSRVFCWKLSRTIDPFGNRIDYEYARDSEVDGPRHWDQVYLKRIRYADYTQNGQSKFLISVTFVYEDGERPDPFSEYRAGFEVRTRKRCARIETRTHADTDRLVHTCQLTYADQRADAAADAAGNGVSLLSQVRLLGHDEDHVEELPPLEFGYTRFEPVQRKFERVQGADIPARSLANPDYELVDLFGNGLPDVLEMNGSVRYWRNLGGGHFDRPREMAAAPAGLRLAAKGVQILDADGDGRPDLMVATEQITGYFPLRFDGLWDGRSFQRYRQAPSFDLEDPEVRLLDLNGDGVTDALRSGTRLECFFNDPAEGWISMRAVERRAVEEFPNVSFSDPRIKFADMSGDGLQDIVLIHDGHVEYWPNLGHGNWAKRVSMQNSPRFPYGYDPRRILVGDIDGDGLADLIYVGDATVTLWINQSGNAWSKPIEIRGTPRVSDLDALRLVDLHGTGVSGLLWSADADGMSPANMYFLDFTGGTKPYLLTQMNNHMGAVTRVKYLPSTKFYLDDEQRAETRWKTPLPFPVQVVARVEVIDAISGGKLTTEYSYHHGYWDGVEREFRGFGRVDQRDTEVFEDFHSHGLHGQRFFNEVAAKSFSPPLETRTWFHQGPVANESGEWQATDYSREYWVGDAPALARPQAMTAELQGLPRAARRDALRALRGLVLRTEVYALDGTPRQNRPYSVTEELHGVRQEAAAGVQDGFRVFFPHVLAQRTTQWERGVDPLTRFTFTDDYDAYGDPRKQSTIAVPRGRDYRSPAPPGEPYLATYTVTTYAARDDADHYLVGCVARTTSYEILNDGTATIFALHAGILAGTVSGPITGQTLNFFDGEGFQGLPFGQLGQFGVVSRSESLVLTEQLLCDAYRSGAAVQTPPELPPYFALGGTPAWNTEYPLDFRDLTQPSLGYIFQAGGEGTPYARGYFVAAERRRFDFQENPDGRGRGLTTASRDALGRDTTIAYDAYDLLPIDVADAVGLTRIAAYDYRVLQPREVTDPNGNRTAIDFTPLGLVKSAALMGKVGQAVGDLAESPAVRLVYDFSAYHQRNQPVSVRTMRRLHHAQDTDVPLPEREQTIETVEFSDGFGRLLQTRTQAQDITLGEDVFGVSGLSVDLSADSRDAIGQSARDDAPRVVVTGWQNYDNKGQVVEKYEPFFSLGWDYAPPLDAEFGQRVTLHYDPRGQVILTTNPDGSQQRVAFGVPTDLAAPDSAVPTPWEAYTYDANDNAGRTHPGTAGSYQSHWNTPTSVVFDTLGRTVQSVARNGPDPADWYTTRSRYDIRGNLLTVTDALGHVAFQYGYDLADRPLRVDQLDTGLRRTILDAAGSVLEARDSKGALILHAYDELQRPIRCWARDGAGQSLTLRERLVYGDAVDSGLTRANAAVANRLGRLFEHYDEAGRVVFESYDFRGNLLEKVRQVISNAPVLAVFTQPRSSGQVQPFRVEWQPPSGSNFDDLAKQLLDDSEYRTSFTYDALHRIKTMRYPQDVDNQRKELRPHYNRAGALERVELDGTTYVEHIAYNARGQRMLIACGNGVMTRYAYDPRTFRLARLRSERFTQTAPLHFHATGAPLQDFAYEYDLAGNITTIRDRTPGSGIPNTPRGTNALDRTFSYDPLYRLLAAIGRECDLPPPEPWDGRPRPADLARTRAYTERYAYDPLGNLLRLRHEATTGGFTRDVTLVPNSNRLAKVAAGQQVFDYAYDASGNLVRETTSRHFEWDHSDRLRVFRTQVGDAEPSIHVHYLYDAAGQRVKKLVRKQGGQFEATVYIDGMFEHHCQVQGDTSHENNVLHLTDNEQRIALVRVGAPFSGDVTPAVQFVLGDHLGSTNTVTDDQGNLLHREEYTPFGETSFGSFAKARYRFTRKERDEESGLYYHVARYYAPWLARWVSPDPLGPVDGVNLYPYARNNPIRFTDLLGGGVEDEEEKTQIKKKPVKEPTGSGPTEKKPSTPASPDPSKVSTKKPPPKTPGIRDRQEIPRDILPADPKKPAAPDSPTKPIRLPEDQVPTKVIQLPAATEAPKTNVDIMTSQRKTVMTADPAQAVDPSKATKVNIDLGGAPDVKTKVITAPPVPAKTSKLVKFLKVAGPIGVGVGLFFAAKYAFAGEYGEAGKELVGAVPIAGDVKDGVDILGMIIGEEGSTIVEVKPSEDELLERTGNRPASGEGKWKDPNKWVPPGGGGYDPDAGTGKVTRNPYR